MTIQPPKPMPKHELKADIAGYEKRYVNKANTLSQFFNEHVVNGYDLAELDAAELVALHEKIAKKPRTSLIILELKK